MKFIYSPTSDTAYVKMYHPYWLDFDNMEARVVASSTDPNIAFGELRTSEFLPLSTGYTYSREAVYMPNINGRSTSLLHAPTHTEGLVPINLEINNPGAGEDNITPTSFVAKTSDANMDFPYLLSVGEPVWDNVYDELGNKRRVVVKNILREYDEGTDTISASVVIAEVLPNGIISGDFETYPLLTFPAIEQHTVVAAIPVDRYFLVVGWHEGSGGNFYHSLVDVDGTVHDLTSGTTTIPAYIYTYFNYVEKPVGFITYDRDNVYVLTGTDSSSFSNYADLFKISLSDKSVSALTSPGSGVQRQRLPEIDRATNYSLFVYDGSLHMNNDLGSGRGIYRYNDSTSSWEYIVGFSSGNLWANARNSRTFVLGDSVVVLSSDAHQSSTHEFDMAFVDLQTNDYTREGIPFGELTSVNKNQHVINFMSVGEGVYMLTPYEYYAVDGAKIPF